MEKGFPREHSDYPVKNARYDGRRVETGSQKLRQTIQTRKRGGSDQNGGESGRQNPGEGKSSVVSVGGNQMSDRYFQESG